MHDPRQPRTLRARTLAALVIDANGFSRGLIGDILRSLDVGDVASARTEDETTTHLLGHACDLIVVSWEEGDALDGLGLCRRLRRQKFEHLRRLPILFVTSTLTRQMVIDGRDAGVDEFLSKPISPAAMRQRLEMVVETPRPFVDCDVFIGPCRRRKNPADYHGAMRRAGDVEENIVQTPLMDHEEAGAQTPIRRALAALRESCRDLRNSRPSTLAAVLDQSRRTRDIASSEDDTALQNALLAFDSYISVAAPLRQVEEKVLTTSLGALEQLATLPISYTEARDSVAIALAAAIKTKLAA